MFDEPAPYGLTNPRFGNADWAYLRSLGQVPPDDDGAIWITHLLRFRDRADYGDGADRGLSGLEAYERYGLEDHLAAVGANVVLSGRVAAGTASATSWDRSLVVKFPSRRAFADLVTNRSYLKMHAHKDAALSESVAVVGIPSPALRTPQDLVVPRWQDTPHPATDDDSPVVVVHLTAFTDAAHACDPSLHAEYARLLAATSVPHGARSTRVLSIEGTIVAQNIDWHEVRFTAYPSAAAFASVFDELKATDRYDELHRSLVREYRALVVRPSIDRIAFSFHD